MAKKSIDDIPDEILLHIFVLLDAHSLKEAILTQKRYVLSEFKILALF